MIGGAGHVGLPLAMTFADVGHQTLICDINREAVAHLRDGRMPFVEDGGPEMLARVLGHAVMLEQAMAQADVLFLHSRSIL